MVPKCSQIGSRTLIVESRGRSTKVCILWIVLLIDGMKFDLRLYVLVTSFTPLRAYLYSEGLARFSTVPYSEPHCDNYDNRYMHLTNYAVNCTNEDFIESSGIGDELEEGSSKRTISYVRNWLDKQGFDSHEIWRNIRQIIYKTLLAIEPIVAHEYRMCKPEGSDHNYGFSCFQLLGFDVLLDCEGVPWLLEVNGMPSLRVSSPLDAVVKQQVVMETLRIVSLDRFLTWNRNFAASSPKNIDKLINSHEHGRTHSKYANRELALLENFELLEPTPDDASAKHFEACRAAALMLWRGMSVSSLQERIATTAHEKNRHWLSRASSKESSLLRTIAAHRRPL